MAIERVGNQQQACHPGFEDECGGVFQPKDDAFSDSVDGFDTTMDDTMGGLAPRVEKGGRRLAKEYRWLLAGVLTLVACRTHAQETVRGPRLANQVSKRGAGSAATLRGRVALVEFFIADPGARWTPTTRTAVAQRMSDAKDFIHRHALILEQEVSFLKIDGLDIDMANRVPLEPFAHPGWTERVIQRATGLSGGDFVAKIRSQHQASEVALCLHVNRAAISYNLAYYSGVRSEFAAERMVCFHQYPDGRLTTAATYAHEILHLFGAGDLYFPQDTNHDRKELARRWFPHDVMFRVDYDIDRLTIGPFTAYRVGWSNHFQPRWKLLED